MPSQSVNNDAMEKQKQIFEKKLAEREAFEEE